jgi:hypothetical protein
MVSQTPAGDAPRVGFKRHLRVQVIGDEAVYLLSTRGVTVLHGAHAVALAPLLDGTRTLPDLLRAAASWMPDARSTGASASPGCRTWWAACCSATAWCSPAAVRSAAW